MAAAYRSDEAGPGSSLRDWRSRLVTQRVAEELRLGPLSEEQTALVTTLILDTGIPAPKDVVRAVYARTDGIPLYIEELIGAVGADARANGRAVRDAIVPDTIEDAVLRRLGYCSREAQEVARAGAVIGRCFTADVLAGVMGRPQEDLDGPLQELKDQFLLTDEVDSGVLRLPAPAAARGHLSQRQDRRPASLPRASGHIRSPAHRPVGDPRLGPFRAGGHASRGARVGACRRRRGGARLPPS